MNQIVYKPGSVCAISQGSHSSGINVTIYLTRPTRATVRVNTQPYGLLPLLGLAPDGVFPAIPITGYAVRSYRTFSPLPASRRYIFCGTFPRVTPAGRYPASLTRRARTFLYDP